MRALLAILVISSLVACASPGPDVPSIAALRGVEDQVAAAALAGPPPADHARLVIASGRWDDTGMGKIVLMRETSVRGDVVIQNQRIAFVANGQALVIDLPPGAYALRWEMRDIFSNAPNVLRHVIAVPLETVLRAHPGSSDSC